MEEKVAPQKSRPIRTMAKDLARLREEEVGKEREKIMGLRAGEETKRRALEEVRREKEEREKAEFLLKLKKMEEGEREATEAELIRKRENGENESVRTFRAGEKERRRN